MCTGRKACYADSAQVHHNVRIFFFQIQNLCPHIRAEHPETILVQQRSAPLFSLIGQNLIMAPMYSALQLGRHSAVIYAVS